MKKTLSVVLAATMVAASLSACGGSKAEETTAAAAAAETTAAAAKEEAAEPAAEGSDPLKVVYLVNGSLGDKGFFDSAASGIKMMEEKLGAETKIVEMGRDETSYEGNYLDVSEQDWDMIISGTFSVSELAQQIASEFPEKDYLIFDCTVDRSVVTEGNMMGVAYYSNQGAFLAGALAAKMLESGDARIDASQKTLGFVGSMDTAGINDFLVGYLEGVKYIDPEIKVLTSYVGSFEDVPKCTEMTTQLYNQGAQIVYAPASQSIMGAATAAADADKYLIACDQDLYAQLSADKPELADTILSTSLKNIGESLFTAVEGWVNGTMTTDTDYTLGLDSGAVGLAKNENYEKIVPAEIAAEMEDIEAKIISGEIAVSTAFEMTTEDVAALRDSMKP